MFKTLSVTRVLYLSFYMYACHSFFNFFFLLCSKFPTPFLPSVTVPSFDKLIDHLCTLHKQLPVADECTHLSQSLNSFLIKGGSNFAMEASLGVKGIN